MRTKLHWSSAVTLIASFALIPASAAAASRGDCSRRPVGAADRAAIQNLIASYGPYFDYHQAKAWASLFTPDGQFSFPLSAGPNGRREVVKGRAELIAFATRAGGANPIYAHFPGQSLLVQSTPGKVYAFTPVETVPVDPNQMFSASVNGLGAYSDTIVRTREGWRFQTRTATIYGSTTLPPQFLPCPGNG